MVICSDLYYEWTFPVMIDWRMYRCMILLLSEGLRQSVPQFALRVWASVLLLSDQFSGGVCYVGLVTHTWSHLNGVFINQGMSEEIIDRLTRYGWGGREYGNNGWFYPEGLKIVLEEMALEANVHILFDTTVIGVDKKEKTINSLQIYNRGGVQHVTGKTFVDCTGDAELTALAGGEFLSDEGVQATSLRFSMTGVNLTIFRRLLHDLTGNQNYCVN